MPRLETGEEIIVTKREGARLGEEFQASVVLPGLARSHDHHSVGSTEREAVQRLRSYINRLRGASIEGRTIRSPGELKRVNYREGDIFLLTVEGSLSAEANERVQAKWRANFPDIRIVVIGSGTTLGVIGKEDSELDNMRARKDQAYLERNRLVAFLAALFPSVRGKTHIDGWDPEWHNCVHLVLPTGQASWHYHDSHAELFAHVPEGPLIWDGHTTEQKYDRIRGAIQHLLELRKK